MRVPSIFSFLVLATLFFACDDVASTSQNASQSATDTLEVDTDTPTVKAPECALDGEMLDGNEYWNSEINAIVRIKADSSTMVEGFGLSHRILEVLDGNTCEQVFRHVFEENESPDFPYFLADIQYNKVHSIIGVQGFYDLYICDLANDYKVTTLKPEYFSEREYDDPQTGMIAHLEVWEDYLLGYAQDCGAFAFDLSEASSAKAMLPFAEWTDADSNQPHALFLIPQGDDTYQAIMPYYDYEEDAFVVTPLLKTPVSLSTNVTKSARDNRFLVLREAGNSSGVYAIDLEERELANLPVDIAGKNTQDILKYMEAKARE